MPDEKDGLRRSAAGGFVWSLGSAVGQAVLQLGSVAVLARLLTPSDFGQVAAASLVVGLIGVIAQMGISAALVQAPALSEAQVLVGSILAFAASTILGGGIWLLAPVINPVVGLDTSSDILRVLSLQIPILGLSMVPLGILQRTLQFRRLAIVDVSAYLIGIVGLGIFLAASGAGAYALVYGQIADAALTAVGYLVLSRPRFVRLTVATATSAARALLRFGLPYSVGQVGNWVAQNADNFIVTSRLSPTDLGIYSRAYQLLAAPANLIGGVADKVLYPAMSRVQGDLPRMSRAYVSSSGFVSMVTIPASVILCAGAPFVVDILLGPKWTAVVVPLQVFSLVLLPRTAYKISGSFTRARGAVVGGATRQWLYATEVVVFCLIGSQWGVVGVAAGASFAVLLHYLTMVHFSAQVAPGLWRALGRMYLRYLPLVVVDASVALGMLWLLQEVHSSPVSLGAIFLAVITATVAVVAILRRHFRDEVSLLLSVIEATGLRRRK